MGNLSSLLVIFMIVLVLALLWAVVIWGVYVDTNKRKLSKVQRLMWVLVATIPLIGGLLYLLLRNPPISLGALNTNPIVRQAASAPKRPKAVTQPVRVPPVAHNDNTITAEEYKHQQRHNPHPITAASTSNPERLTQPPLSRLRLHVIHGPGKIEQDAYLHLGRTLVGAQPDPSRLEGVGGVILLTEDAAVSGNHAVIEYHGNHITLHNVSARDATWVKGGQIRAQQSSAIGIGDTIRLGNTELKIADDSQMPSTRQYITSPVFSQTPPALDSVPAPLASSIRGYAFAVLEGPHAGARFPINQLPVIIGREKGCAILLTKDEKVSRRHAELYDKHGKLGIRDLESRLGTSVNGYDIEDRGLSKGDRIRVGATLLVVQ